MASVNPRKRLQEEVTCPVCFEYFTSPVTLVCEHSVCRACVLYSQASPVCPLCKRGCSTEQVKLNYGVAAFVEINKLLNGLEEPVRPDTCERHQEPLNLFCMDSEVLICTVCEEEHRGRNVIPVEEAAQEYEDRISASLEALKIQKEEIVAAMSATQAESEDLLKQMEAGRQKMVVKFADLWPFVESQEARTRTQMDMMELDVQVKKHQLLETLADAENSVQQLNSEMEEAMELPASLFLQDVDTILERSEQRVENPAMPPIMLRLKGPNLVESRTSLRRAIKNFRDSVTSCY